MIKKIIGLMLSAVMFVSTVGSVSVQAGSTGISIGDYMLMGNYLGEDILWRCVDIDENGPLMLSDKILCVKAFDSAGTDTSGSHGRGHDYFNNEYRQQWGSNYWGDSNINDWLNSSASLGNVTWTCGNAPDGYGYLYYNFYNNTDSQYEAGFLSNFSKNERSVIKEVTMKQLLDGCEYSNVRNDNFHIYSTSIETVLQNFDTAYSENTTDKMFLLDVKQLYSVYSNSSILGSDYYKAKCTEAAVKYSMENEWLSADSYGCYWLRSPFAFHSFGNGNMELVHPTSEVRYVASDGAVNTENAYTEYGIRPAFYLNTATAILKSGSGTETDPYISGTTDINLNGETDGGDAAILLKKITTARELADDEAERADVNGDGSIDLKDAVAVLQNMQ